MIKEFISEVNGGKSLALLSQVAEAAKSGKKVVLMTLEVPAETFAKRLAKFGVTGGVTIIEPNSNVGYSGKWFFSKIMELASGFEVVAVDSVDVFLKKGDFERLDEVCFGSFMNTCNELWVTRQAMRNSMEKITKADIKKREEGGLFKVKQIVRRSNNEMFPEDSFIEVIDLENHEIKYHNLSNIFKNN